MDCRSVAYISAGETRTVLYELLVRGDLLSQDIMMKLSSGLRLRRGMEKSSLSEWMKSREERLM
jgi:hypothetical protein